MSRGCIVLCLVAGALAIASLSFGEPPLAEVRSFGSSVEFSPIKWGHGFLLRVVAPDGSIVDKTVKDGAPSFDLSELKGPVVDGRYKYELRLIVSPPRDRSDAPRNESGGKSRIKVPMLSGSFLVAGGSIVPPGSVRSDEPLIDLSMPQGGPDTPDLTINENLYVLGAVGIGTTSAGWDLHIKGGYLPGLLIEQDASAGYTAQGWDVFVDWSGRFVVRDPIIDSYPLAIESGAPSDSLTMRASGKVGFGTYYPSYTVEVERTGVNSAVVVERTDGATNYINATAGFGNFGTVTNHPLRLAVNGTWQMRLNNDASIVMANGASLTAGGVWTNASSRALKQDIQSLSIEKATAALADLDPVEFAYKSNGERHVGFIAEDVPDLVASADRSGLSPMDLVAVLTRVVQRQQSIVQAQQMLVEAQQMKLREKDRIDEQQQATINQLISRISTLESK